MNIANNPQPWLSRKAKEWLNQELSKDWVVLEFGGGSSSIYFLPRVSWLFTIEHNVDWHKLIVSTASRLGLENLTTYRRDRPYYTEDLMKQLPDEFFDLVLVDGRDRVLCARAALSKVKPGGYLMFDDFQRKKYHVILEDLADWEWVGKDWKPGCKDNPKRLTTIWRRPA